MNGDTTKDIVLNAVIELYNEQQEARREEIASLIDLPMVIIDERLKILVNQGELIRVKRGVYKPRVSMPPTRIISISDLPDGTVTIDIGDDVLTLTPREARTLALQLAGRVMQVSNIGLSYTIAEITTDLGAMARSIEKLARGERDG